jgi:hypothetical protein
MDVFKLISQNVANDTNMVHHGHLNKFSRITNTQHNSIRNPSNSICTLTAYTYRHTYKLNQPAYTRARTHARTHTHIAHTHITHTHTHTHTHTCQKLEGIPYGHVSDLE